MEPVDQVLAEQAASEAKAGPQVQAVLALLAVLQVEPVLAEQVLAEPAVQAVIPAALALAFEEEVVLAELAALVAHVQELELPYKV